MGRYTREQRFAAGFSGLLQPSTAAAAADQESLLTSPCCSRCSTSSCRCRSLCWWKLSVSALMLKYCSSLRVWRVSSAKIRLTLRSIRRALKLMSSRLPMGVPTTYSACSRAACLSAAPVPVVYAGGVQVPLSMVGWQHSTAARNRPPLHMQ